MCINVSQMTSGDWRRDTMTEAEILHDQARVLRDLASRFDADDIKELLLHLAQQCEALAKRLERQPC